MYTDYTQITPMTAQFAVDHKHIYGILQNMENNNRMFTAWDITSELRNMGGVVFHSFVRDCIHDLYVRGEFLYNYKREFVDLITDQSAWVYYPAGSDPFTHPSAKSNKKQPDFTTTKITVGNVSSTLVVSGDASMENLSTSTEDTATIWSAGIPKSVDATGRLRIPATALRIGNILGEELCVYSSKPDEYLMLIPASRCRKWGISKSEYHIYKYDKDSSIRFSPGKYGLKGSAFKIEPFLSKEGLCITSNG